MYMSHRRNNSSEFHNLSKHDYDGTSFHSAIVSVGLGYTLDAGCIYVGLSSFGNTDDALDFNDGVYDLK